MFNILFLILMVLEPIRLNALPEETYLLPSPIDDDLYVYMDTRSENDPKQTETRRRSILDRNFARLGRGDLPALQPYDYDSDVYENFERQTRSGEKTDQFIRFGRGNSDFVRFGRDRAGQHFLRFGRSVNGKTRSKREAEFEKRTGGNNFVRFGRNDNFMRFGRDPEEVNFTPTTKPQQKDVDNKNEYLIKLLVEMLRKARPHGETLRLA